MLLEIFCKTHKCTTLAEVNLSTCYLIQQKLRLGGGQRGGALPAFPATSQEISGSNLITPRRFDMCHQKTVEPRTLIEIILIQVTTFALIS